HYRLNPNWSLTTGLSDLPANAEEKQPHIMAVNAGFQYTMRRLSADEVARREESSSLFPKQLVQVGYASNAFGYGVNDFVSKGVLPVFWAANVEVARGGSLNYQQ